jgi:hypothetical protein
MGELKVLLDATEIAVRGPGWPSTANVNDAPNPWSKQHWNLTNQAKIFKRDQAEANRLNAERQSTPAVPLPPVMVAGSGGQKG